MNAIVRMMAVYTGFAVMLCAMTQMDWSPLQPNGSGQWLALFLLIFPSAVLAEFLGAWRRRRRAAVELDPTTVHCDCSWGRLLTGVTVMLITFGVVLGAAWWLSHPAANI